MFLALSDANHAVSVANDLLGPYHLIIQFHEYLAVRGDNRVVSIAAQILQDSTDGRAMIARLSQSYSAVGQNIDCAMLEEVISQSCPAVRMRRNPLLSLTTIIVNNDGGGIFSFLPIAKHGKSCYL